jgi:hypothetical protein
MMRRAALELATGDDARANSGSDPNAKKILSSPRPIPNHISAKAMDRTQFSKKTGTPNRSASGAANATATCAPV